MQPYFFPYIDYFQLINEVDEFVLYDEITFRKNSWLNWNRIKDKGTSSPEMKWKDQIFNLIFFL